MVDFPRIKIGQNKVAQDSSSSPKVNTPGPIAPPSLFKGKVLPEEGVKKQPPSMGKYKIVPDPASNPGSKFPKKISNRTKAIGRIVSSIVSTLTGREKVPSPPRTTQVAPDTIIKVDSKETVASSNGTFPDLIDIEIQDDTGK